MRWLLSALLVCALLLPTAQVWGDEDSPDDATSAATVATLVEDEPAASDQPADAPAATDTVTVAATATPMVDVAPLPEPSPIAPILYSTRNGPKSSADLQAELSAVGYGGPWDLTSMLAAYDRATAPPPPAAPPTSTPRPTATPVPTLAPTQSIPSGPTLNGQPPSYCAPGDIAGHQVYTCIYPDGSGASWRSATDWTLLSYRNGASGPIQFTHAGLTYLGVQTAPPLPVLDNSPQPTDSNLATRLLEVNTLLGRGFPQVRGQVCNLAQGWAATDITIRFAFYYDSLLPTLDSGTAFIDRVNAGDCSRFNKTLTALQPWRTIVIDRVNWTWRRQ